MKHSLDVNENFVLQRWNKGVKLNKPNPKAVSPSNDIDTPFFGNTIHNLLNLPFSVYFLSSDNVVRNANEIMVATCGYGSIRSAIGKTTYSVFNKYAGDSSINHNYEVMKKNKIVIKEQDCARIDGINFQAIAIRLPWYDEWGKTIGVFGCSIPLGAAPGAHPVGEALLAITKTGLLPTTPTEELTTDSLPGRVIGGVQLSSRETDCIQRLMLGKTAKMIAQELALSPRTVEYYINNAKKKLGVSTKMELIDRVLGNN